MTTNNQKDNMMADSTNTFESTIKALRPFIKAYAMASNHQVKIWIQGATDAPQLEAAIKHSDGKVSRGSAAVLFADYGDMDAEDAYAIVKRVMGSDKPAA
jgi:hypothetical protein